MYWKRVLSSFLIVFSVHIYAQNINTTYSIAESQFELQNYEQAAKLYQRVLFFDSSETYIYAYARLAQISLANKEKDKAILYYSRYRNFLAYSNEEWKNIGFKLVGIYLSLNLNKEALGELFQMQLLNLNELETKRLNLYLAVAYFQDKDFGNSKNKFKSIIDSSKYNLVDRLFKQNDRLEKRYNSYRMQIMSAFVPGSGQIYSGFYKEGINSFVLVGAFLTLFVHTSLVYGLIDGVIAVYPWISRYHTGGVKKAGDLAKQRVVLKRTKYYHELLELV